MEYLKQTFGFEERLSQTGAGGRTHTELLLGPDDLVMIGQAWEGLSASGRSGHIPPP
jgi:hypothetical protein